MDPNLQYSFKELYDVRIKSTYNMEINGRIYEPNEIIAIFNNIQLANLSEIQRVVSARGGFDNRPHVTWVTTKEINFTFSQGVFSNDQFSLLTNAKLIRGVENTPISLDKREIVEADENGKLSITEEPLGTPFFYNKKTMDKLLLTKDSEDSKTFIGAEPYTDIVVDYSYNYYDKVQKFQIGKQAFPGYVSLEGKTKIKDDTTGQIRTGIITIPKLKIVSNLSITLGERANPAVGTFYGVGYPTGARGNSTVMETCILNDDIDSDIQ